MTWTPEQREEMRRLEKAATPGPWVVENFGSGQANVAMPRDRSFELGLSQRPFGTAYGAKGVSSRGDDGSPIHGVSGRDLDGLTEGEYAAQRLADAHFIAACRTAVPAMQDEIERLRTALGRIAALADAPAIDAEGDWQLGLHCGVEDRSCRDCYEGADYGHTVGVEKALDWAVNEANDGLRSNDLSDADRDALP